MILLAGGAVAARSSRLRRRSEIGLRRAVGYGRLEIARLIVFEAAGVGIAVGILAGSYPAIRAARITPMSALRP